MKANAPEKIWIDPANDLSKLSGHIDNDSVEYVRKNAFIEKACQWLYDNLHWADPSDFLEDFEKYMEE